MKNVFFKVFLSIIILFSATIAVAQTSFVDFQKSSLKVSDLFSRKEDTLKKQFEARGLKWPAKYIYIRSFKYDGQLEVWVKNEPKEKYQLFKTYKVCMQSGTMGPKRFRGDYQVPEGCYYINEFNPNSNYHLALGINYPNAADHILSDSSRPGGEIYIHGNCVSEGCIPVNDQQIEEIYVLSAYARAGGEDFIPVHVFPIKYNVKKSQEYLAQAAKTNPSLLNFSNQLKSIYEKFEEKKQIPVVMVNKKGEYLVD